MVVYKIVRVYISFCFKLLVLETRIAYMSHMCYIYVLMHPYVYIRVHVCIKLDIKSDSIETLFFGQMIVTGL